MWGLGGGAPDPAWLQSSGLQNLGLQPASFFIEEIQDFLDPVPNRVVVRGRKVISFGKPNGGGQTLQLPSALLNRPTEASQSLPSLPFRGIGHEDPLQSLDEG